MLPQRHHCRKISESRSRNLSAGHLRRTFALGGLPAGPSGLMARAETCSTVGMKIVVEENVVLPVRTFRSRVLRLS